MLLLLLLLWLLLVPLLWALSWVLLPLPWPLVMWLLLLLHPLLALGLRDGCALLDRCQCQPERVRSLLADYALGGCGIRKAVIQRTACQAP